MKPYIAKDTGEPLVVMGGYHIGEGGTIIPNPIDMSKSGKPEAKQSDIDLLEKHGESGLEEMQYHGVLDRLRTSGLIR